MSFHPHEQRALAPRPVEFGDKKRPRPTMGARNQGSTTRHGFDPDDLSRRLYHVIAKQEGRSVAVKDAQGNVVGEQWTITRDESKARASKIGERIDAQLKQLDRDQKVSGAARHFPDLKGRPLPSKPKTERTAQRDQVPASQDRGANKSQAPRRNPRPPAAAAAVPISSSLNGPRPMSPDRQPGRSPEQQSNCDSGYRHVPQVAASQFERTTTTEGADDKNLIHKLSQHAMNFHLSGPEQDMARRNDNASPIETMHSLERVRSQRDREYDRNQFQHPPILEELASHDDRQYRLPARQTFETHFNRGKDTDAPSSQRFSAASTSLPRDSIDFVAGMSAHRERAGDGLDEDVPHKKWKTDWTQSDEVQPQTEDPNQRKLRKAESRWTLKGKLPMRPKSKENAVPTEQADMENLGSPKSPRPGGFFGRFKRG